MAKNQSEDFEDGLDTAELGQEEYEFQREVANSPPEDDPSQWSENIPGYA